MEAEKTSAIPIQVGPRDVMLYWGERGKGKARDNGWGGGTKLRGMKLGASQMRCEKAIGKCEPLSADLGTFFSTWKSA